MCPTKKELQDALTLAVALLAPYEPPDSRAVSNEFVALAELSCGNATLEAMAIIRAALTSTTRESQQ